jgi:glycosyltransferase involved in cell wall biosynthesis
MTGVTFLVPVYNKGQYLPRVLRQIASQTGAFRRQYVFVDDGSTDGSGEIVRRQTSDWDNVVIIRQPNAGSAAATNAGVTHATEPFLKFVDADDLLVEDATEILLGAIMDSDAVIAYGGRQEFGFGEIDALPLRGHSPAAARTLLARPLKAAIRNSLCNPSQMLARTEAVRRCGGCDERVVFSQEYSLTLRLARLGPFVRVERLVAYVLTDAAGRLSNNEARQLQRTTQAVGNFVQDFPDLPPDVVRFACRRAAGRAWRFLRRSGLSSGPFHRAFLRQYRWLFGIAEPAAFIHACAREFDRASAARDVPIDRAAC